MQGSTSYDVAVSYMGERLRTVLQRVGQSFREKITEIRLRSGRPVTMVFPDRIRCISTDGILQSRADSTSVHVSASEISGIVNALCRYSVHSYSRELREGFFMLEKGVRVGIAGTVSETAERTLRDISSLNFRISRSASGCAQTIVNSVGSGTGILICGGVNSGKTTILRDYCRICGERYKLVLIDERNEISASIGGIPSHDIGLNTDVLVGTSRSSGIVSAIRTLSPDMIFCDEISTNEDTAAIMQGYGSGVRFAATIHASSFEDLMKRRFAAELIDSGVFAYAVILSGAHSPACVAEIRRFGNAF